MEGRWIRFCTHGCCYFTQEGTTVELKPPREQDFTAFTGILGRTEQSHQHVVSLFGAVGFNPLIFFGECSLSSFLQFVFSSFSHHQLLRLPCCQGNYVLRNRRGLDFHPVVFSTFTPVADHHGFITRDGDEKIKAGAFAEPS